MARAACFLLAVGSLVSAARARAQPEPEASAALQASAPASSDARGQAKALTDAGLELVREGDVQGALEKFQRAYEAYPDPNLLINMGSALRFLGRPAEAEQMYQRYVSHPGARPEIKSELERNLEELRALLGTVTIRVHGQGVTVRLDGTAIPMSGPSHRTRVAAGEHTLTAEFAGKPPSVKRIVVEPRGAVEVELFPARAEIEVVTPSALPYVGLAVSGIGVAIVGLGATFGLLALDTKSDIDSRCGEGARYCDAEGKSLEDRARTEAMVSTLGFAIGGAVLTAGIAILIAAPSRSQTSPKVGGGIQVGPGRAVLGLRSSF